jgi:multiple sugar transport system substrate-binding protein
MSIFKNISKGIFALSTLLLLGGCGLKGAPTEAYKIDLEVWGVFDDSDAYQDIFSEYQKINPYIGEIHYRKLQPENYEEELLQALAANKGPDIFMLRNAWVGTFQDKIEPAPATYTEKTYREAFVDVVAADFMGSDNKIYGAPLSADSLALYYNKDLFNAAGITRPPTTWEELASDSALLTKLNAIGGFEQSGVALGTATNINRSTDILSAMMFQLGVELGEPSRVDISNDQSRKALEFYTQFAKSGSPRYAWNSSQHYSIDAFYEGTLGMMINYSWQYPTIKQKNAKLNIGIAPLPQFIGGTQSNIANYWGYAVTRNKEYISKDSTKDTMTQDKYSSLRRHESWQLLRYMTYPQVNKTFTLENGLTGTTKDFPQTLDPGAKYLEKTKKPAARRDLIALQQQDVVLGPFASGNLLAKQWQHADVEKAETILAEAIESVVRGERTIQDALNIAGNRLRVLAQ